MRETVGAIKCVIKDKIPKKKKRESWNISHNNNEWYGHYAQITLSKIIGTFFWDKFCISNFSK